MSRTLTWHSNNGTTFTFARDAGVWIQPGVKGLEGPIVDVATQERVGGHGAVVTSTRYPRRVIALPVMVASAAADLDWLVSAFAAGGGFTAETNGRTRSLRNIVYVGGLEGHWDGDHGGRGDLDHRKYVISLIALDPWWYDFPQYQLVDLEDIESTDWNAAVDWNAAMPWSGGSSVSLSIDGDIAASPRLVFEGELTAPVSGASVRVGGDGVYVEVVRDVPADQAMEVDTRPGSRGPHQGSDLLSGQPVGLIDFGWISERSRLFDLPTGEVSLTVEATGADTGASLLIAWEPRYLTP